MAQTLVMPGASAGIRTEARIFASVATPRSEVPLRCCDSTKWRKADRRAGYAVCIRRVCLACDSADGESRCHSDEIGCEQAYCDVLGRGDGSSAILAHLKNDTNMRQNGDDIA
jgi:hypothetical protein